MREAAYFEQLAEECAELAHASLKYARILRGENPTPVEADEAWDDIIEEWADVNVVVDMLQLLSSPEDQTRWDLIVKHKSSRWKARLDRNGGLNA